MRRRVTFSRNLTLSLSRTCRCHCKYCAFATHQAHLHEPEEVERLIDGAARRHVKELLVLTGEAPDHHPGVRDAARPRSGSPTSPLTSCGRASGRSSAGLLPHTNLGVLSRDELARLRAVTASQGLMLESVNPDLVAHQGSPTKHPAERLATIAAAQELRIPFTSGILVGIGESEEDRVASLEALAGFDHLQEVILQNFVPHRRYYGEEPADIATDAADSFWRTGLNVAPEHGAPKWATPVGIEDMKRLIAETRRLMPGVGIQVPPNLADWWPELVAAGATDLGGLSANGDHISPEHPFPSPHQVRKRLAEDGVALAERLCVYGRFIDAEWIAPRVLDVIRDRYRAFIPRRGARGHRAGHDRARPRRAAAGAGRAGGAVRREPPGGDRGHPPGRRRAARRAGRARPSRSSSTATSTSRTCAWSAARSAASASASARPTPTSTTARSSSAACTRRSPSGRPRSACSRGSTRTGGWRTTSAGCGWRRRSRRRSTCTRTARWRSRTCATPTACRRPRCSGGSPKPGLDSVPGTAAEVLDDGVRQRISPNKLPVARWVEIIEAAHRVGLRSTVTVMFGHIETPQELAEHMRVVRALQERTGGFTEFVPLSFIPFHTQLGRTHGIEEISREENLKHTAVFRLALGRTIPSLQASWVKMGLDAATEALRWGVNDLGGTLMEESISRMAGSYHGVRLDPPDLVAAAHRAGRPAAERTTLYGIRRRYEPAAAA